MVTQSKCAEAYGNVGQVTIGKFTGFLRSFFRSSVGDWLGRSLEVLVLDGSSLLKASS